ncbi:hypothetical protein [Vibrio phage BONAISHI]|nr:hypothetical protein [Vibrio phage BONAISHI]
MSRNRQRFESIRANVRDICNQCWERHGSLPNYWNGFDKNRAPNFHYEHKRCYQEIYIDKLNKSRKFRQAVALAYDLCLKDREESHAGIDKFKKDTGFSFRQIQEINSMIQNLLESDRQQLRALGGKSVSSIN